MVRDLATLHDVKMDYVLLASIRERADPLAGKRHLVVHSLWSFAHESWNALQARGTWKSADSDSHPDAPRGLKAVTPEGIAINVAMVREWIANTEVLITNIKNSTRNTRLCRRHRLVNRAHNPVGLVPFAINTRKSDNAGLESSRRDLGSCGLCRLNLKFRCARTLNSSHLAPALLSTQTPCHIWFG